MQQDTHVNTNDDGEEEDTAPTTMPPATATRSLQRLTSSFLLPQQIYFTSTAASLGRTSTPPSPPQEKLGDIFLDLFYVAAAYNLGHLLREDPTREGLLYLLSCFFSIQSLWMLHLLRDGRFQYATFTLYETVHTTLRFLALACAVLHIRPAMMRSQGSRDMFLFSLSIAVCLFLHLISCFEIMYCQLYLPENQIKWKDEKDGEKENHPSLRDDDNAPEETNVTSHPETTTTTTQSPIIPTTTTTTKVVGLEPAAFDTAVTTLQIVGVPFVLVLAAVIYSGREYYRDGGGGDSSIIIMDHGEYDGDTNDDYSNSTTEHRQRQLAEQGSQQEEYTTTTTDHVAIYLLLASSLWMILFHAMRQMALDLLQWDHKRSVVPINVEYAIHRYGEWTMLMLGETVLSLLIVEPIHNSGYYSTFFAGVLSIIMVEYLHFISQPHDPDHHALRRSIYGAILHTTTMMFYSASLIVLGASFKMLLYEFVYEEQQHGHDSGYKDTTTATSTTTAGHDNTTSAYYNEHNGSRNLLTMLFQRELAGSSSSALRFDTEDRQQRIAIFFSGSMAVVWFCQDVLILAHSGYENLLKAWKESYSPVVIAIAQLARVGMLLWFVTLHQYVMEPKLLSLLGVIGLFGQIVLQMIIYSLCPISPVHKEEEEINRALEYANARLHVIKTDG